MKFIVGGRGSGKTTRLLEEAAKHKGCVVVVPNERQKELVREYARQLGISVEIETIDRIAAGHLRGRQPTTVAVDNAEEIVQRLFGHIPVRVAALNGEAM